MAERRSCSDVLEGGGGSHGQCLSPCHPHAHETRRRGRRACAGGGVFVCRGSFAVALTDTHTNTHTPTVLGFSLVGKKKCLESIKTAHRCSEAEVVFRSGARWAQEGVRWDTGRAVVGAPAPPSPSPAEANARCVLPESNLRDRSSARVAERVRSCPAPPAASLLWSRAGRSRGRQVHGGPAAPRARPGSGRGSESGALAGRAGGRRSVGAGLPARLRRGRVNRVAVPEFVDEGRERHWWCPGANVTLTTQQSAASGGERLKLLGRRSG